LVLREQTLSAGSHWSYLCVNLSSRSPFLLSNFIMSGLIWCHFLFRLIGRSLHDLLWPILLKLPLIIALLRIIDPIIMNWLRRHQPSALLIIKARTFLPIESEVLKPFLHLQLLLVSKIIAGPIDQALNCRNLINNYQIIVISVKVNTIDVIFEVIVIELD
jgi:hypothetical protein